MYTFVLSTHVLNPSFIVKSCFVKRITVLLGLCLSLLGFSFVTTNDRIFEISKNIEIFINVFKELNANYVDQIDPGKLMRTGIDAMVSSLDPYTNYISESQVESYRLSDDVRYSGLGATMDIVDGELTIMQPFENSALAKAGIKAGDKITKISGLSTKGKSIDEANQILRGVGGSGLNLTIKNRQGKETEYNLERTNQSVKNVPYYGFVSEDIGYIALTTFTQAASKNIAKGFKELKTQNPSIKGLILDLRDNGGGLLREAVNVSNIFMPKDQLIVSTKGKLEENDKEFKTIGNPMDLQIPLAVLINKKSASASEIVSGVVQDLDRGVIVGQRSYGKGLVQNHKEVGYNSRIKLTTSKYYIPSGRCIQSVEYADGEPKDIDDAARSKFKTKNGREVLDGGGITPDLKLPAPELPDVITKLNDNHIIFKFVNELVDKSRDTLPLEEIAFTDFSDFVTFSTQAGFRYISDITEEMDRFEKASEEKEYYPRIENDLNVLRDKVKSMEKEAISEYKDLILVEINKELASRFYYKKGEIFATLDQDSEIKTCIDLLTDTAKYQSFLN